MRLIDADTLIERIGEWMPHDKCGEEDIKDVIYAEACVDLIDVIKEAPTVKPKKGKWVHIQDNWYQCSECGAVRKQETFMEYFCPNCGAYMYD